MFARGMGGLLLAALLAGCVIDGVGTDYAAISQKVGPPKSGQSRIVVLQEKRKGLSMALCACDVKLDGSPIGKVTVGTYAFADRPAGRHLIRSSERHDSVTGVTMIGGLAGALVASAATTGSGNPGPADFFVLDETAAKTILAELQRVE
jgi:hypothetical protein